MATFLTYPEAMKQPRIYFTHYYAIVYGKENQSGVRSTHEMLGLLTDSEVLTAIARGLYKPSEPSHKPNNNVSYKATQLELFNLA